MIEIIQKLRNELNVSSIDFEIALTKANIKIIKKTDGEDDIVLGNGGIIIKNFDNYIEMNENVYRKAENGDYIQNRTKWNT